MTVRYPLDALSAAARLDLPELRRALGISGATWKKLTSEGVTEVQADRWAVRLGLSAANVWPELLDAAIDDALRDCAAGCGERFFPKDSQHAYCSPACRNREKMRRYRATEAGAEANRRHRRAYYRENRDYELAQWRLRTKGAA